MHGAERVEHIARWLAIAAALVLVVVVGLVLSMELARVVDVFPPRLARRGLRIAREAMFLLPVLVVLLLGAVLAARHASSRSWRSGFGFGLCVVGGVLLVAGVVNLVAPLAVFPSQLTCVFNSDMVLCEATPWIGAPFAVMFGAALILIGANRNRSQEARDG